MLHRWLSAAMAGLMVAAITTGLATGDGFRDDGDDDRDDGRGAYAIGLWGDLPYSDTQALTGVPNLITDMNRQDLAFTAQDGDLKGGNSTAGSVTPTTCSDALYTQALGFSMHSGRPPSSRPGTMTGPIAIARRTVASRHVSALTTSGSCSSARRSRSGNVACASKCRRSRCVSA